MSASTYIENTFRQPSFSTRCPKRLGSVSVTTMEELLLYLFQFSIVSIISGYRLRHSLSQTTSSCSSCCCTG